MLGIQDLFSMMIPIMRACVFSLFMLFQPNLVVKITYGIESISGSIYMIIDAKKRTTNPFFFKDIDHQMMESMEPSKQNNL